MTNGAKRKLYPFDWLLIGYCLTVVVCIAIFGRPIGQYADEIVAYSSIAAFAALIIWFVDEERGGVFRTIRYLYPVLTFVPLYRLTGGTIFLIFDRFYDYQLIAFEEMIFGIEPTLFIDRHLLQPVINEVLSFCYFSYYFMMPTMVVTLLVAREYRLYGRAVSALTLTFALSFLLFFLWPIEGPRWVFASQYQNAIDGYFFRDAVQWIIAAGAVHGGAMPSSHTAVALLSSVYLAKRFRLAGRIMGGITFGLAIGTFWGRYHYVSDVVVGVAIALFSHWLIEKYYDRWTGRTVPLAASTRVLDRVS